MRTTSYLRLSWTNLITLSGCLLLIFALTRATIHVEAQGCANSPPVTSRQDAWAQNTLVQVNIDPQRFNAAQINCITTVVNNFNNSAITNSSGVRFSVTTNQMPVAILDSQGQAVNMGSVAGLQINRPQNFPASDLGVAYPGTNGTNRTSGVIEVNPNITNCLALQQTVAHEIGHTFGLDECPDSRCGARDSIMTDGVCAVSGPSGCTQADYDNTSKVLLVHHRATTLQFDRLAITTQLL